MRRVLPLVCAALAACQEPSTPVAPDEPATAPVEAPPAADDAPADEAAGPRTLSVRGAELRRGDEVLTQLRPADAPGRVDDGFEAVYDHPSLAGVLPKGASHVVDVDAETTVGALRQIWASVVAPGESLTLKIGDATHALTRAAPDEAAVLRPRAEGWALYRDDGKAAEGAAPAAVLDGVTGLVAIDVLDASTVDVMVQAIAAVEAAGATPALSFAFAPCVPAPKDMVCIPGGPAIVGYDDGLPEEAPARELVLSTYYVDRYEVTNSQYDACHEAGACKVRINRTQTIMKPFVGEEQPAMPMDWHRARSYCAWAGKRLPTEWEWEKAARGPDGELFPWGNDEPTCDKTVFRECAPYGCKPYPGKAHRWDCNEHA
ncbi:MAG: SUMF1/EgtB/PvdO family nonheme iron enzyme, partial [Myxococcota bacterium]